MRAGDYTAFSIVCAALAVAAARMGANNPRGAWNIVAIAILVLALLAAYPGGRQTRPREIAPARIQITNEGE
jgi:hypothetical protein